MSSSWVDTHPCGGRGLAISILGEVQSPRGLGPLSVYCRCSIPGHLSSFSKEHAKHILDSLEHLATPQPRMMLSFPRLSWLPILAPTPVISLLTYLLLFPPMPLHEHLFSLSCLFFLLGKLLLIPQSPDPITPPFSDGERRLENGKDLVLKAVQLTADIEPRRMGLCEHLLHENYPCFSGQGKITV